MREVKGKKERMRDGVKERERDKYGGERKGEGKEREGREKRREKKKERRVSKKIGVRNKI